MLLHNSSANEGRGKRRKRPWTHAYGSKLFSILGQPVAATERSSVPGKNVLVNPRSLDDDCGLATTARSSRPPQPKKRSLRGKSSIKPQGLHIFCRFYLTRVSVQLRYNADGYI